MIPAGWLPDPSVPDQLRYWDGAAWTEHTAPGQPVSSVPTQTSPDVAEPIGHIGDSVPRKVWHKFRSLHLAAQVAIGFVLFALLAAPFDGAWSSSSKSPAASSAPSTPSPTASPEATYSPPPLTRAQIAAQAKAAAEAQAKAKADASAAAAASRAQAKRDAAAAADAAAHPTVQGWRLVSWTYGQQYGSCGGKARVTNTNDTSMTMVSSITLLDDSENPVAKLQGSAQDVAPGQTVTLDLVSSDSCPGRSYNWDFQIDTSY